MSSLKRKPFSVRVHNKQQVRVLQGVFQQEATSNKQRASLNEVLSATRRQQTKINQGLLTQIRNTMKAKNPRHGSMQFWPRKRAKKQTPRIRAWAEKKEVQPLAFPGYKAGMTHVIATDNRKASTSAKQDIAIPVTIIECPPMKIYSAKAYRAEGYGVQTAKEIVLSNDKELSRTIDTTKKIAPADAIDELLKEEFSYLSLVVYTQPKNIGFKKKPELFELRMGGSKEEQVAYIKERVGKEIPLTEVFAEGDMVDLHAVTTGRGFQGAVKRFGISLKSHKSEKGRRTPGSLGGWKGQAHFMYRVAHAGQMGYHLRTQYNNPLITISSDASLVNPKGGLVRYGEVKNTYVLVKGSVPGPKKRLIVMTKAIRPTKTIPNPTLITISTSSPQGR